MEEAFGRAGFAQHLKRKGIDVNKMHSDNVKDAEAAKKRAASAQSDLDSFRKKTGVTSESSDDFEPHMMYDPKTGKGTMAKVEADHIRMKKMGYSHDKPDVKESVRGSFKTFVEATYTDSGWQKPKKDNMSDADAMNKAKKLAKNAVILTKSADALKKKPVAETKGAPKGYHFTRDGKLKKGDAGADGDGGAKLRSDPLDKQRSKIPPLPEKFANPAQQAAVMAKLKKSGKYDGKEATADPATVRMMKDNPHMVGQDGPGGMKGLKKNTQKKVKQALGKDAMKKEATIPDGQTVMTKKDPVKKNDMDKLAKIRKMLDREKKK